MNAKEYIKNFKVLIFDMGNTLMFNCDRFAENEDFEATFNSVGGKGLNNAELFKGIKHIYESLITIGRIEARYESFPQLADFISSDSFFSSYSRETKEAIEKMFPLHEAGKVPDNIKTVLEKLSKTHKLGLISNVWAKADFFKSKLTNQGVSVFFDQIIFSSAFGIIKPSPKIFKMAAKHFKKEPDELVYIGDNYKRDVIGSKESGMNSILINNSHRAEITSDIKPDCIISSIEELV